jgi:hypothetical protein
MKSPQKEQWLGAMHDEINLMKVRGVWHLESLPSGKNPVGCRWVYATKRDDKGNIVRFRAGP